MLYVLIIFLSASHCQFSVPWIEYSPGGSSKKGSHVYFLLQVYWVILLFDINAVLMLPWWSDVTIVQSDVTIVVSWQLSTGSKHDYLFRYCPLVGILFEVLRIGLIVQFQPTSHCHGWINSWWSGTCGAMDVQLTRTAALLAQQSDELPDGSSCITCVWYTCLSLLCWRWDSWSVRGSCYVYIPTDSLLSD